MLGSFANDIDRVASAVSQHRANVTPVVNEVLSAVGGSSQRVDGQIVDQLHAVMSALSSAEAALAHASALTRGAERIEWEAERVRREAAARAAAGN